MGIEIADDWGSHDGDEQEPKQDDDAKKKQSQASLLVQLARERFDMVLGNDGRPYAVAVGGPNIARSLRGRAGLRELLAKIYGDVSQGGVPSASALADALTVLDGHARIGDPVPVHLRVAPYDAGVVVDLGTSDGRCVTIDAYGWRVASRSPVLFRRSALTMPLPDPIRGRNLDALRDLLNVDEDGFRLLVGWLLAALLPEIPHPILALFGEQGTAKSTAARVLVSLIDPSPAPLRSAPRDIKQWSVTASASWTVALDNCSGFPSWLSDTLCKAVTGDGIVDRALYTDDDVMVLAFRRVIALTAIDAGALRGDLAERLLPVELRRIPDTSRRREAEILSAFDNVRPEILGALLSLLGDVLRVISNVRLTSWPRMADFARVLAALDEVTGWKTTTTYADSATDIAETVIDSDPFAVAIRDLVETREWTGTTSELLAAITPERAPRRWPRTVQAASGALRRVVPALAQVGVQVTFGRGAKGRRSVTIIPAPDKEWECTSTASPRHPQAADLRKQGDEVPAGHVTPTGAGDAGDEVPPKHVTHPQGADLRKHPTGDEGDEGDAGPHLQLPTTGPCVKCGEPTHRYGDGGAPLCGRCRSAEEENT